MKLSFSINDIPEFSSKERIVVVGFVGKSDFRYPNKSNPILTEVEIKENGIQCHWDEWNSILYLHTVTSMDTQRLAVIAAGLDEDSKATETEADASHWLVAAGELAMDACRIMALMFNLCHIVVLSSPSSNFDLGFLQLFKAIDAYRTELTPQTTQALMEAKLEGTWHTHGRNCCPRLLFHFRRAPRQLRGAPAGLKRLEHAVEDQLYFILRKARLITNVCAKSLFAIPKNEEYVYIDANNASNHARDVSSLLRDLVELCGGEVEHPPAERGSFAQFLLQHVEMAKGDGFDDNVGKYGQASAFFELPSAASWRAAARALAPVYLTPREDGAAAREEGGDALYDALATDVRFSQARCAKVLPIAQASYAEGLPAHYSSQHHEHKLAVALGVLGGVGRGPWFRCARSRLVAHCTAAWRARRTCEAASLTGNACVLPQHEGSSHSSGVRYIAACNCGRCKCSREDPYSLKKANYTFYTQAAEECGVCNTLQTIDFPVFEPSTPSYRAASVNEEGSQDAAGGSDGATPEAGPGGEEPEGGWSPREALSPPSNEEDKTQDEDQFDLLIDKHSEKGMVRQPSTTEYLPGMLHAGSPAGLLPCVRNWSLVCLGASSLYSHSLGLPEHLQPGFLPHTNYLVPWDCAVKPDAGRVARGVRKPAPHVTVKIFIGLEYECPRGHRFMMSGPDSPVSGSSGCGREAGALGARLASSGMPLYTACVCRTATPMLAQLMRVHVVTPKAQLRVTLDPRVQPITGGPIFIPQPLELGSIKLSPSAYWVLRLPYIYAGERGALPRPSSPHPPSGTLAKHMFGLAD